MKSSSNKKGLENIKSTNKVFFLLVTLSIFIFSIFNLLDGYSMVGEVFPGFGSGINLVFQIPPDKNWTGYNSKIQDYDRLLKIDGIPISSISQVDDYVRNKSAGTPINYTFSHKGKIDNTTVRTMEFSFIMFVKAFFLTFVISFFYLLIGIFVIVNYRNKDKKIKSLLFFTLMISAATSHFYQHIYGHRLVPLGYVIQYFTLASMIQLGLELNEKNIKENILKKLSLINFSLASILSFSIFISSEISKDNIFKYPKIFEFYLSLFNFGVFCSGISVISFASLILFSYLKSPLHSLENVQNRIIFTGSILSFSPLIVFWFIPVIFGYSVSYNFIFPTFILLPIFLTYAIVRYKAFDIEFLIRKGLVYAALSSTLVFGYFSLSTLAFVVLKNFLHLNQDVYMVASAIIATIITGKLDKNIQNVIDKAFYRHKLDLSVLLEEFIHEVINVFDKADLLKTSISYLEKTVNPASIGLYLPDHTSGALQLLGPNNTSLPNSIKVSNEILNKSGNKVNQKKLDLLLENESMNLDNAILLPLQTDKETIGYLVLGDKKSELEYLFEEKNFLKNFTASLSMALNNLLLKEETVTLVEKNTELEEKSQFLKQITANLSHDLKFPLSSAYSIVNKIKYKMDKKSFSKEFVEENMADLSKSLKKIGEYISISLDRELISLGKLSLKNQDVDMKQVCFDAIFLHSDYLQKNSIDMKCDFPEGDIFVSGDSIRLESVISNLISNAIKYGNDSISLLLKKSDSELLIELKDNGSGIDEDVKGRIFDCYVKGGEQIANSGKDRSTGLGLYICKAYIEMMQGSIWFESEKDKGTTFFIKLPLINKTVSTELNYNTIRKVVSISDCVSEESIIESIETTLK